MKERSRILGYEFVSKATYVELADDVMRRIGDGSIGIDNFVTPNAHGINTYAKYPELEAFCQGSAYLLPDGQPLVWLSRFANRPIEKRLTGSDFFPVLFEKLRPAGHRVLFVLSNQSLSDFFRKEKPDAFFYVPPFFDMKDHATIEKVGKDLAALVQKEKVNYVFIGISEPKQGALSYSATRELRARGYAGPCLFFFLGASYEFYAGLKKRAPLWLQRSGLEWFYRLATEPRRMYKRYIIGNAIFVFRAMRWLVAHRRDKN